MTCRDAPLFGGIEAGGTKFVLAVGSAPDAMTDRHVIPTRDPETTLAEAVAWFTSQGPIAALGVASFGPVELSRHSERWGHILDTPKPDWSGFDLVGHLSRALERPIGLDTDVNAAALAEYRFGAGRGAASLAYMTVGTGIGVGLVINGETVHGAGHPEFGHYFPRREAGDRDFVGICTFHGDCLEGLSSGPAIVKRWGKTLSDLPPEHEAHHHVSGYLAQACHTLFAAMASEVIVIGGGVAKTPGLVARVASMTADIGANYLPGHKQHVVRTPALGIDAGIIGALALACDADC